MAVSASHIMDVMIGVCAGSPPHIALCVCSVQERIGTYSGTYRNGNKTATGQGVQAQLDKPSGSCRAISPFTDFVEELYRMCTVSYTHLTLPTKRIV